jgi:hypothetical protein
MKTEDVELLGRIPRSLRAVNGVPEPDSAVARGHATVLASDALADLLLPGGVRTSPLGPRWSRDIDLHLLAGVGEARSFGFYQPRSTPRYS